MQLPIVATAPIVAAHAGAFRGLFENRRQFQHFQNFLTGLIVLPNKSLANMARCVVESANKTDVSAYFSEAPWFEEVAEVDIIAACVNLSNEVIVAAQECGKKADLFATAAKLLEELKE